MPAREDAPVAKGSAKVPDSVVGSMPRPPQAAMIDAAFTQRAGLQQALTANLAPAAAASAAVALRAKTAFEDFKKNPTQYSDAELARRNHVTAITDPSEMLKIRSEALRRRR